MLRDALHLGGRDARRPVGLVHLLLLSRPPHRIPTRVT
jgi:hypothetical protein